MAASPGKRDPPQELRAVDRKVDRPNERTVSEPDA